VWIAAAALFTLTAAGCYGTKHIEFRVCTKNDTWVRPTEEQMEKTAWQDPRFRQLSLQERRAALLQNFSRYIGSSSISGPIISLSGLGEFPWANTDECGSEEERHSAASRYAVEIWALLYDVTDVVQVGDDFRVVVRPIEKGFRAIQFDPGEKYDANVEIVDEHGGKLACFGPASRGVRCR